MFRNQPVSPLSFHLLRLSLGVVYIHFGILKFFPDLSPAELLASQTIMRLSGGWLDASQALFYLAIMECTLGLAMLFNVGMRWASILFLFHMAGTFAPLFLLPELTFKISPLAPTIEGQYILKNIVFVAAGVAIFLPYLFPGRVSAAAVREEEGQQISAAVAASPRALSPASTSTSISTTTTNPASVPVEVSI